MAAPSGPPSTGSTMRQRFGWYFMGIAIGLLMLGLLWQARYRAYQQHQAQQQQQQQAQPPSPAAPPQPAP